MKITILCVGKVKEKFYRMAIDEYVKRLGRYCKLEIIEVADEKTPDNASEHEETLIKDKEGERILKNIRREATVIALAIEGKMFSSEQLAGKISQLGISGESHIGIIRKSAERGRPASELFKNDVPASIDAGDSAGTDLPKLSNHTGRALS